MSYQIELEKVLLPEWKAWGGSGCYDVPGRDVVFKNGAQGSLLISSDGITVYKAQLHHINTEAKYDEGEVFVASIDTIEKLDSLNHLFSEEMLEEIAKVWNKFIERENSFI